METEARQVWNCRIPRGPVSWRSQMALTKCLVELHGGSIAAHSEGEGCGSTFTIRLPGC